MRIFASSGMTFGYWLLITFCMLLCNEQVTDLAINLYRLVIGKVDQYNFSWKYHFHWANVNILQSCLRTKIKVLFSNRCGYQLSDIVVYKNLFHWLLVLLTTMIPSKLYQKTDTWRGSEDNTFILYRQCNYNYFVSFVLSFWSKISDIFHNLLFFIQIHFPFFSFTPSSSLYHPFPSSTLPSTPTTTLSSLPNPWFTSFAPLFLISSLLLLWLHVSLLPLPPLPPYHPSPTLDLPLLLLYFSYPLCFFHGFTSLYFHLLPSHLIIPSQPLNYLFCSSICLILSASFMASRLLASASSRSLIRRCIASSSAWKIKIKFVNNSLTNRLSNPKKHAIIFSKIKLFIFKWSFKTDDLTMSKIYFYKLN